MVAEKGYWPEFQVMDRGKAEQFKMDRGKAKQILISASFLVCRTLLT